MSVGPDKLSNVPVDVDAAARYVLDRRTPQGGYSFYRTPAWGVEEPNAPDTLAALEALRILGIEPPEHEMTVHWLRGLQAPGGGYPTLTIGWAALGALHVLSVSPAHAPDRWIERWASALLGRPVPRDWRAFLPDALRLVELLRLAAVKPGFDWQAALSKELATARDPLGGWARPGPDLETTAIAVRLGTLARLPQEDDEKVAHFLRRCEDEALGMRLGPGAGTTSVSALRAGLLLALELGIALRHPAAIAESLALLQRPDGGLGVRHHALSTLRDTRLGLEAAQLLEHLQEDRS